MYPMARFSGGRFMPSVEENNISSSKTISPLSGLVSPDIQFSNVVLPLPEGPKMDDIPFGKYSDAFRLNEPNFFFRFTFKKVFFWLLVFVCVLERGVSITSKRSVLRRVRLVL